MKTTYKNFEIKATYKGNKKWGCSADNFNNHMIKVKNTDTNESITFEFWGSISNPIINTTDDLMDAFYCFVSDSMSGFDDFKQFCNSYDYEEYIESPTSGNLILNREVKKIHNSCIKSLRKLEKIYNGCIYDLLDQLQEN